MNAFADPTKKEPASRDLGAEHMTIEIPPFENLLRHPELLSSVLLILKAAGESIIVRGKYEPTDQPTEEMRGRIRDVIDPLSRYPVLWIDGYQRAMSFHNITSIKRVQRNAAIDLRNIDLSTALPRFARGESE